MFKEPYIEEMQYQEELEKRPHLNCTECGKYIHKGDYFFEIKGVIGIMCKDCVKDFMHTYEPEEEEQWD